MPSDVNKATIRTLQVLAAMARQGGDHGVSELAATLGMTKTMVHRALATLEDEALVVRAPNPSRYQLGWGLLALSPPEVRNPDLVESMQPFLEELHELTAETVTLGVRSGHFVVYVATVRGKGSIAERVTLGDAVPMHSNPAGQAIMAFLSEDDLQTLLAAPLERFTPRTIVDPAHLTRHLAQVRADGFARGSGGHLLDVAGFGVPLFDLSGAVCASVTISGPAQRLPDVRVDDMIEMCTPVFHEMNRRTRLLIPRVPVA